MCSFCVYLGVMTLERKTERTVMKNEATPRKVWSKKRPLIPELDFLKIQIDSYNDFLSNGIAEALAEVSGDKGIEDYTGKNWSLSFGKHYFGRGEYDIKTSRRKETNYSAPLYAEATLINKKTGQQQTQEVFLGDIPMMTPQGTFIINGIDRAVVTQLVRAPGVSFSGETDSVTGRLL